MGERWTGGRELSCNGHQKLPCSGTQGERHTWDFCICRQCELKSSVIINKTVCIKRHNQNETNDRERERERERER